MDSTNIIPVNIEDEMRGSYMDYAMSVIIGRALPDVRDGLKPVHRRILYAMLREGLTSNKGYSKCAGVVGEVLKKYHPHGDSAVYNSLVRMAQPWNLRYPLIDGQGNFGSIDGDSPAAYRYTESRMTQLAETMLADIDKDTVDFADNFDGTVQEPIVLPSLIPGLLVNGAEGIAVGMASSIPPHNLSEVVQAAIRLIEEPEVTTEELMELVPAPDFPTGGIIYGSATLRQIYETGRGLLKIRGRVRQETLKGQKKDVEAFIIDEVPYQVNKAKLIEKIAELVNDKRIEGIARLRDESDRKGMRVVIELKRDAVPEVVLNQLYGLTSLQRTYGVTMLAIVEGRPQVLSLRAMLQEFNAHRRTVVTRRCRFELAKAEARLHILEGLMIALSHIDEVIEVIKQSETVPIAKARLIERFSLSEVQAQHILDMPLRRLTALERKGIEEEASELEKQIAELKRILSDIREVDRVIVTELKEILERFGDERRTTIEENADEIELEDMIAEEDMVVTISHKGYVKRCSPSQYRAQGRGGKGVRGSKRLDEETDQDFISDIFIASTHAYLLVFTNKGKLYWLKVYKLPEMNRTARGRAIVNMLELEKDEFVSAILPVREFEEGRFVVIATRQGYIKRVDLMAFSNVRKGGIRASSLDEGDEVMGADITDGSRQILLTTRHGMSIRFPEETVRAMGRTARGVRGISLGEDDVLVGLVTVAPEGEPQEEAPDAEHEAFEAGKGSRALLSVCENGYGKRTRIEEYRSQGRGGKGIIDIKTTERNGNVVRSCRVYDLDEVMLVTNAGTVIRIPADSISLIGRNTQGVRLISLAEGEKVAAVARLAESEEKVEDEGDAAS
ncbi:MAG: DNA gyrase subunit A [Bdellovibrionales bacterium]|nr:DNA gyrase subunit A [Bdellovibrionales bacterium]